MLTNHMKTGEVLSPESPVYEIYLRQWTLY